MGDHVRQSYEREKTQVCISPWVTHTQTQKRSAGEEERENWKILLQLHHPHPPIFLPSVQGRKRKRRTKPKPEITWHSPFSPIQRGERVSSKLAPMTPWLFPYRSRVFFANRSPPRRKENGGGAKRMCKSQFWERGKEIDSTKDIFFKPFRNQSTFII